MLSALDSVCLAVTFVHCDEINQTYPYHQFLTPIVLVLCHQTSVRNFNGTPLLTVSTGRV